jgi:hypothetical protein
MGQKNLGITMADAAVKSISTLNNSPNRSIEIYEKIRLAQEENEEVANAQGWKAYLHGASAVGTIFFSITAQALMPRNNQLGEVLNTFSKTTPEVANIFSANEDGSITLHSQNSRVADVANQRLYQQLSTNETLIGRHVEQIGRLLAKEI